MRPVCLKQSECREEGRFRDQGGGLAPKLGQEFGSYSGGDGKSLERFEHVFLI